MKNFILAMLSIALLTSIDNPKEVDVTFTISFKDKKVQFEFSSGADYTMAFHAHKTVLLNQYGMVSPISKSDIEQSEFLIEYAVKGNRVTLNGIKGVKWDNLTLRKDSGVSYVLNEDGILDTKRSSSDFEF